MGPRSDEQVLREVVFGVEDGAVGAVAVVLGGDGGEGGEGGDGGEKERQGGGAGLHCAWRRECVGAGERDGREREDAIKAQLAHRPFPAAPNCREGIYQTVDIQHIHVSNTSHISYNYHTYPIQSPPNTRPYMHALLLLGIASPAGSACRDEHSPLVRARSVTVHHSVVVAEHLEVEFFLAPRTLRLPGE